jgi:hypothetical protein
MHYFCSFIPQGTPANFSPVHIPGSALVALLRPTLVIHVLPPTGSLFCDQADRKRQVVLWFPPAFLYKPELSAK